MSEPSVQLKQRITADTQAAMRAKDKSRLGTMRLILAAIKQVEVDQRRELDDTAVLAVMDKMVKQSRDSIAQFQQAGREDLVAKETAELELISSYLPQPLTDAELDSLIGDAIAAASAVSVKDMGKVMGLLKPKVQGRADMGRVSGLVKKSLGP